MLLSSLVRSRSAAPAVAAFAVRTNVPRTDVRADEIRNVGRPAARKGSTMPQRSVPLPPRCVDGDMRMLDFLANNIEQLGLALEHIRLEDANNCRFGLMLTDNAVEITLHQTALDARMMA